MVILGTGWAAHALLKDIDASKFDVTTVSPRNFFLFTPMLAASAGAHECMSIMHGLFGHARKDRVERFLATVPENAMLFAVDESMIAADDRTI